MNISDAMCDKIAEEMFKKFEPVFSVRRQTSESRATQAGFGLLNPEDFKSLQESSEYKKINQDQNGKFYFPNLPQNFNAYFKSKDSNGNENYNEKGADKAWSIFRGNLIDTIYNVEIKRIEFKTGSLSEENKEKVKSVVNNLYFKDDGAIFKTEGVFLKTIIDVLDKNIKDLFLQNVKKGQEKKVEDFRKNYKEFVGVVEKFNNVKNEKDFIEQRENFYEKLANLIGEKKLENLIPDKNGKLLMHLSNSSQNQNMSAGAQTSSRDASQNEMLIALRCVSIENENGQTESLSESLKKEPPKESKEIDEKRIVVNNENIKNAREAKHLALAAKEICSNYSKENIKERIKELAKNVAKNIKDDKDGKKVAECLEKIMETHFCDSKDQNQKTAQTVNIRQINQISSVVSQEFDVIKQENVKQHSELQDLSLNKKQTTGLTLNM